MCFSAIRFWAKGWIEELYLNVPFQFHYYGFEWVTLPSSSILYTLFIILILSSLGIAFGFFYRSSAIIYFLSFTYIELIDKTLYLNHYYFVSLVALLLIFCPANRALSIDSKINPSIASDTTSIIFPLAIKLQLSCVYFFAGLAKINSAWLIDAMPLRIWLPARGHYPIIGPLLTWEWSPYIMSWSGMLYDLFIPFLLFWRRSRPIAYLAVVVFHAATWWLFNIGVFPWVMIVATLIFFDKEGWQSLAKRFNQKIELKNSQSLKAPSPLLSYTFLGFILIQAILPFRQYLYEGSSNWNEKGFRFAWNVMRVEKTAYVEFLCVDPKTNKQWLEFPSNHLTLLQETQMSYQPDMLLEFAHYLEKKHNSNIEVYARVQVSLNGSQSMPLVDSKVDLTNEQDSLWGDYSWVINQQ